MIRIKLSKPFNLKDTLTCGQIFRYFIQDDGSYDVILSDRIINVYKDNDFLCVTSNNEENLEEIVIKYFDLDNDYDQIDLELISKDDKIKDAVLFSKGLNMINQDHFETLIEYIISANNGVPQISGALNSIAKNYGKKVAFNNKEYYLFPQYNELKDVSVKSFRACKVGFRDKYIYEVIQKLNNNIIDLEYINELSTQEALDYLMQNKGIGPKVASCILLFSYNRYDVFPIDTWVKKIMKSRYGIEGEKNIRIFAKDTYGKNCGIALQYLFNESRNKTK